MELGDTSICFWFGDHGKSEKEELMTFSSCFWANDDGGTERRMEKKRSKKR